MKEYTKDKYILDVTCGGRGIWFNKNHPNALYCDKRHEHCSIEVHSRKYTDHTKHLYVDPDIICDFTHLPFEDNTFYHVVFDPPHVQNLSENAWFRKEYGSLDGEWRPMIRDGFHECMRVLRPYGTLTFKWSDISVSTREILNVIGENPLYGHRSGKKMNTHWMLFMKIPNDGEG